MPKSPKAGVTSRAAIASIFSSLGLDSLLRPNKDYVRKAPRPQVRKPNILRNPKIAKQIAEMHEKWVENCYPSKVRKQEADPNSISSIKLRYRVPRAVARKIKSGEIAV